MHITRTCLGSARRAALCLAVAVTAATGGNAFAITSAAGTRAVATPAADYASHVNVFIGTGGHGHTYPGASVPHGAIQPSPDTRVYGWDACSGYYHDDTTINGFSHTHLSGTGCCDLGEILLMPTVGTQDVTPEPAGSQRKSYASAFSHDSERACPGYYSVELQRYGVRAELTASLHGAMHRWTFPASKEAGVIMDLDYNLEDQTNKELDLQVVSDTELCGHKLTQYWAFDQVMNFYVQFSKPFTCTIVNDTVTVGGKLRPRRKALLHFATAEGEVVLAKVGVSAVDAEGARRNVLHDMPAWDFDGARAAAREQWNAYLGKIDITTSDEHARAIFYTALYHTGLQPSVFTDVDGRYLGMDLKVHQGDAADPVYTTFSTWDTFRALHPLMTIIDPTRNEAYVRSLLLKAREGGVLPMWELHGNYTGCMIGYHTVPIITDAYVKGARSFDINEAFQAMLHTAHYNPDGICTPRLVANEIMPQAKYWKDRLGYVPCDKDKEAVAKALEYAYDDWCISRVAEAVGDTAGVSEFGKLAKGYAHYYDPSVGFMRGKDSNGAWRTPFDPSSSTHRSDDYCEGNAWQWSWFVPHDPQGLATLMGGRQQFAAGLDRLFSASSQMSGGNVSADISGLIGQYAHGNEPSHHVIYLYNKVGQPWKTQELAAKVMHTLYKNEPAGLCGNEDCGQTSAWFVMSAMGLYPVNPCSGEYEIGSPLFTRMTLHLGNGKNFTIEAPEASHRNIYVQSVKLNGKPYNSSSISHQQIMRGGTLTLQMGAKPAPAWYE